MQEPVVTRVTARLCVERKVSIDELRDELVRRMTHEVLLYMSHLRRIEVLDERTGQEWSIEAGDNTNQQGAKIVTLGEQQWLRYEKRIQTPDDLMREDGEPVPAEVPVVLARCPELPGPYFVAAYFPLNVRHDLPWRFSAPFEVTNNREELQDTEYNRWLLARVGEVMAEAAIDLKVGDRERPWRLVPKRGVAEADLKPLYAAAHERLRELAWIPTSHGRRKPDAVAIPRSAQLATLIRPADLASPEAANWAWVRGDLDEADAELLVHLGGHLIGPSELVGVLAGGPGRNAEWYLRSAAEVIRLAGPPSLNWNVHYSLKNGRCFKDAKGRAFSLLQAQTDKKVVCSTRSERLADEVSRFADPFLVILDPVYRIPERKRADASDPLDEPRGIVHAWLQAGRGFIYEARLEAKELIRHLLAEGDSQHLASQDASTHDALLSFVRDHLASYESEYRSNPRLHDIGRMLHIEAFSYDGSGKVIRGRRPLGSLYLGKSYTDSEWTVAASGVPGIWWLHSKYKTKLSRPDQPVGLLEFLRKLGALDSPTLRKIPETGTHNNHRYAPVERGRANLYPNFPHEAAKQSWCSAYGTQGDYECADLNEVLSFVRDLPLKEQNERGKALLRALEQHWDRYKDKLQAGAYGYYSNRQYEFGSISTRWLFELRRQEWVRFGDGILKKPEGKFAATEKAISILGERDPDVCAWPCRKEEVAQALGLRTTVPADEILKRLREAKRSGKQSSQKKAEAYYSSLLTNQWELSRVARAVQDEALIYYPAGARKWWPSDLCLRRDHRELFGGRRAYLDVYASAEALWRHLQVPEDPDLSYLRRYWEELAATAPDEDTLRRLSSTYQYATSLLEPSSAGLDVPVWTDQGWHLASRVVAVQDQELGEALGSIRLPRWNQSNPQALGGFCYAAGITLLDEAVVFGQVAGPNQASPDESQVLHAAVERYAAAAAALTPDLWHKIAPLARHWTQAGVARVETLEVPIHVELPEVGRVDGALKRRALLQGDTLYLSRVAGIGDAEVVRALLIGSGLSGAERFHIENGIRLAILEVEASGSAEVSGSLPNEDSPEENLPDDFFDNPSEPDAGAEGDKHAAPPAPPPTPTRGSEKKPSSPTPSPPAPPPAPDAYRLISDQKSDDPLPKGGPVDPGTPSPRSPQRQQPPRDPKSIRRGSGLSVKEVEQRGVDL